MNYNKKSFRYYYWFFFEFIKKNVFLIIISIFITVIIIISLTSFTPQITNILFPQQNIIGLIGAYNQSNLPDDITKKITNSLLYINSKGEYVPALANSWEVTNNGLIYKFYLKKDLLWNDGKLFTANDIKLDFKDVKTTAVDKHIIQFQLKDRLAIFPNYLTKPLFKSSLVGVAGFYHVDQYKIKDSLITSVILSPTKRNLPRITYKFYNDEKTLINAYKLGEVNEIIIYRKSLMDNFIHWPGTKIKKNVDYSKLMTLFINTQRPMLKEKEIRSAIGLAVNRSLFNQFGYEANSPVLPVSWAYNRQLKRNLYDKQSASETVKKFQEATRSAKLNLNTFFEYNDTADIISENLSEIGLSNQINIVSSVNLNQYDLFLMIWNPPFDQDQYYFWHSTQTNNNISGYKNVKIDKLLEDGRNSININERKKIYDEFQKVIVDDNPAIFLYYPYIYRIIRM